MWASVSCGSFLKSLSILEVLVKNTPSSIPTLIEAVADDFSWKSFFYAGKDGSIFDCDFILKPTVFPCTYDFIDRTASVFIFDSFSRSSSIRLGFTLLMSLTS